MTITHIAITAAFALVAAMAARSIWRDLTSRPGSLFTWHWEDAP